MRPNLLVLKNNQKDRAHGALLQGLQYIYPQIQDDGQQQAHVNHTFDAGHRAGFAHDPIHFEGQDDAEHGEQRDHAGAGNRHAQLGQVHR